MTQLVADPFTYSNGALATVSSGAWSMHGASGGSLSVASNEVVESTAYSLAHYVTTAPPGSDYYSEVVIGSTVESASDEGVGPAVRVLDGGTNGTGYFLQCNSNETKIYRAVNNSFTQIGSNGAAVSIGDTVRLSVSGTGATVTLTATKNGGALISTTDSDASRVTATNNYGVWASRGTAHGTINSFAGGDLSAPAANILRQMMAHHEG